MIKSLYNGLLLSFQFHTIKFCGMSAEYLNILMHAITCLRKIQYKLFEFVEKKIKAEKPKSNIVFIFFVVYPLRLVKHLQ